jgi:2-polyprenyl-6-hydroxyphenyl methylase/3-demethylubiquinone-9 3-methyltransferase
VTIHDPKHLASHFAFGENWQSFVATVTEESLAEARRGLARLFSPREIAGKSFLDIGCGSGLSMLAAVQLGAGRVEGVDIDPNSVAAAHALLSRHAPGRNWSVRVASLFDLLPDPDGGFDIVYSWGVLHHTGDLQAAVRRAAALAAPGGKLAIALYSKTPLCAFWKREKRVYSRSGKLVQAVIRVLYRAIYAAGLLSTGRNPMRYARHYRSARGMSFSHNVHDWLGGYPYESVEPAEVLRCLDAEGFSVSRAFEKKPVIGGLLGSHCDEYVAIRRT